MTLIQLVNKSTVIDNATLEKYAAAIQRQAREDFAPYYGTDSMVSIKVGPYVTTRGYPKAWVITVLDDSDTEGALGYHEAEKGIPSGKVFAKTDIDNNLSVSVTLSHEILEMLADPYANTGSQFSTTVWAAWEVCDAVEADNLGYQINEVQVSDFVLPAWFTGDPGPYSFKRHVSRPHALARGGYVSLWSAESGWQQQVARQEGVASRAETMSRHGDRVLNTYAMAFLPVDEPEVSIAA